MNKIEETVTVFPDGPDDQESACNAEDTGSIPGLRRSPWIEKIAWRREWLPTPVFLPKESHGLASYSPEGRKKTT